jgi:hypothetical protein
MVFKKHRTNLEPQFSKKSLVEELLLEANGSLQVLS